jgi:selenocysteine-specific elongation factor
VHVIATAGHVDHGKSTLVKALTGSDPDRLAEEHDRGLSIELGYCWTSLDEVGDVAFVDVPGHERFISTMLAGIGPVPAVLLVVAADDPWMPQAAEHLAALDALGVRHGVVAVTRADLADPEPMTRRVESELARTSLAGSPVVPVSAVTGLGIEALRARLVELTRALPVPDPTTDVRLWVDRSFHIRGAGTVVTGTLPAGTVTQGDELVAGSHSFRVRSIQSLGRPVPSVSGVARVALNLVGDDRSELDRHSVLVNPGAWWHTGVVDVRLTPSSAGAGTPDRLPQRPLLHVGAAAVPSYLRPLGEGLARLSLDRPLPLRVGDRALLRDPGSRRLWGLTVLDPAPPSLSRRGAAAARARDLAMVTGESDGSAEVERRGMVQLETLRRIGAPVAPALVTAATPDGWLVGAAEADRLRRTMTDLVAAYDAMGGLDAGIPLPALAERLHVPSVEIVRHLVAPPMRLVQGRVTTREEPAVHVLEPKLEKAISEVTADLTEQPYAAPTADRMREVGLDAKAVSAAARVGRLLHLGDGIVLLPGADDRAVELLAGLEQPFTTSDARTRLGTTRRVVLPLLSHLDRRGRTRRLPDDRRSIVRRP